MKDFQVCLVFVHESASVKRWLIFVGFVRKDKSDAQSQALPAFALKTFTQSSAKDWEIFCSNQSIIL